MKRIPTGLLSIIGAAVFDVTGTAFAADIQTKTDCETVGGFAAPMRGVETCLIPFLRPDDDAGVRPDNAKAPIRLSTCDELMISGGAFCEIIIDARYQTAKPDCDAVAGRRALATGAHDDAWSKEVETPLSEAWICTRMDRIEAQKRS